MVGPAQGGHQDQEHIQQVAGDHPVDGKADGVCCLRKPEFLKKV
ncbi:hypothetical protein [Ralstonia pickettii]|nr:hypothetical protein [Ralstonia pickettii]